MTRMSLSNEESAFRQVLSKAATSHEPDPLVRWVQIVEANPVAAASALMYATKRMLEAS